MADLSKLQADVAAQTSAVQSAKTLLDGLAVQVRDLLTKVGPDQQQAINDLAASIEANTQILADSVTTDGTPAAPPASPPPTEPPPASPPPPVVPAT